MSVEGEEWRVRNQKLGGSVAETSLRVILSERKRVEGSSH